MTSNHITAQDIAEITEHVLDCLNDQTGIRFNKFPTKEAEKIVAAAIELALLQSHLTA